MKTFFSYNDTDIHYLDQGKGKVILMVHGFLETLNMWHDTANHLSKHYRVIAVDLPGHGKSKLGSSSQLEMDEAARMLVHLLESLGISKVMCVGHSMGGYVCMALADLFPEYVKGLILFHSHARADSPEARINRGRAIRVVKENHSSFITQFIPDLFTDKNRELYKNEILNLQEEASDIDKDTIVAALSGMQMRPDRTQILKHAAFPVGFIIGQEDIRANLSELFEQIQLCTHAQILMLKEVAHMGYIEDTTACTNFALAFANQHL